LCEVEITQNDLGQVPSRLPAMYSGLFIGDANAGGAGALGKPGHWAAVAARGTLIRSYSGAF
jgi:hypothetical protein